MVKLVYGLHLRSPKAVKLVHGLHQESPRVVELKVGPYHGYLGSDHRSSRVVEPVMRLHQGCYIREHEVSRGSEASIGASPPKMQEGEVHDGTSSWEYQRA